MRSGRGERLGDSRTRKGSGRGDCGEFHDFSPTVAVAVGCGEVGGGFVRRPVFRNKFTGDAKNIICTGEIPSREDRGKSKNRGRDSLAILRGSSGERVRDVELSAVSRRGVGARKI